MNLKVDLLKIIKKYVEINKENKYVNENIIVSWNELSEGLQNYYREQAKHIPNSLLKINYDIVSVNKKLDALEFTQNEIEKLAEIVHTYWYNYRKKIGLKCDVSKDEHKKINSNLEHWDELSLEKKNVAYEMVKCWPEILAKSNFKIDRLKQICHCESEL